jgi:hypothetical protein
MNLSNGDAAARKVLARLREPTGTTDEILAVDILEAADTDVDLAATQVTELGFAATQEAPAADELIDDAMVRANVTQEVRIDDILESVEVPTDDTAGPASHLAWEAAPDAFYHPGGRVRTFGEVTIEQRPEAEPTIIGRLRERRKRFSFIVAGVLVIPLGILAGAAIVSIASPKGTAPTGAAGEPLRAAPPFVAPTRSPPAASKTVLTPPQPSTSMPELDPSALPSAPEFVDAKPTSGTVVGPARRKLYVDGKPIDANSAIVNCGKHSVRVGRARAKTVDVPCGGTLTVK